jgi:hypothetical protein
MANPDSPRGLTPVRYLSGAPYSGAVNIYSVPASDSTAIYIGSLVRPAGSADADGVMTVTGNVATGNPVIGVVTGFAPITADSPVFRPASTLRYVFVADDPNLLFEIQEDSDGGALAATAVGNTADIIGFTGGSATTGFSAIEIDSSTATASGDGTQDVVIWGLAKRPDNEIGNFARWLVRLNNHFLVDGVAGA